MIQPFSDATNATKMDNGTDSFRPRASKNAPALRTARCAVETAAACCENVSGSFQTQTISRINENRENTVLKFAGEISADPGERAKQRDLTVVPCPCHIGEDWQNGNFVVVVPKNEGIVCKQEDAEGDDDESGDRRAKRAAAREWRSVNSDQ